MLNAVACSLASGEICIAAGSAELRRGEVDWAFSSAPVTLVMSASSAASLAFTTLLGLRLERGVVGGLELLEGGVELADQRLRIVGAVGADGAADGARASGGARAQQEATLASASFFGMSFVGCGYCREWCSEGRRARRPVHGSPAPGVGVLRSRQRLACVSFDLVDALARLARLCPAATSDSSMARSSLTCGPRPSRLVDLHLVGRQQLVGKAALDRLAAGHERLASIHLATSSAFWPVRWT
jgi:hypothetical protein